MDALTLCQPRPSPSLDLKALKYVRGRWIETYWIISCSMVRRELK